MTHSICDGFVFHLSVEIGFLAAKTNVVFITNGPHFPSPHGDAIEAAMKGNKRLVLTELEIQHGLHVPRNRLLIIVSDEKPVEGPKVSLGELYRFATAQDRLIMFFSFLAAG